MPEEELPESIVLIPAGLLLYLLGELERLKAQVAFQDKRITEIKTQQDEDCDRFARDIAYDRQRLTKLENPNNGEPTPTELAHLQRIEKHLKESPLHSASFAEIRGLLDVSPGRVSQLIKKLDPQRFEVRRSAANHRGKILVLRRRSV